MRSSTSNRSVNRRRFLAFSAGVTAVGVAGCTDGVDNSENDSTAAATAPFSLLITDAPADIDDFESLNVTFDHARVFPADAVDDEDEDGDEDEDVNTTEEDTDEASSQDDPDNETTADDAGNETAGTDEDDPEEDTDDDENGGDNRGWFILDIAGETVDLTDVVGDVADPVFEDELEEGTYSKVELHVDSVDATLTDGESAEVKVPSEKLQLTSEFDVVADKPLEFVFDINVVRRGRGTEYNLLPVIDGSGVNGEDVDVERREEAVPDDADDADDADADEESGDEDEQSGEGGDNGPPDNQEGE